MSEFLNCVLRVFDTPLISVCFFDYNCFIWSPSKYAEAGHIDLPVPFNQSAISLYNNLFRAQIAVLKTN